MKQTRTKTPKRFVLCVDAGTYGASLERLKLYQVLPDAAAATHRLLRVIDESGEDYLYSARLFRRVTLSPALQRQVTSRKGSAISKRPAAMR